MNCINTSHPEYQNLLKQTNLKPEILKAKIGVWQDKNGIDKYPLLSEIINPTKEQFEKEILRTDYFSKDNGKIFIKKNFYAKAIVLIGDYNKANPGIIKVIRAQSTLGFKGRNIDYIEINLPKKPKEGEQGKLFYQLSDNQVNFQLKVIDALQKPNAQSIIAKGIKNNWEWWKITEALGIPKLQTPLLEESFKKGNNTAEKLAVDIAANYSFIVEINTAKQKYREPNRQSSIDPDTGEEFGVQEDYGGMGYYSNLTVPGGTNYTENNINTPLITPIIKGHAQFSTDKGIGWFRSDEETTSVSKTVLGYNRTNLDIAYNSNKSEHYIVSYKNNNEGDIIYTFKTEKEALNKLKDLTEDTRAKTRRILELQSDWGQKQRKSSEPDINVKYDIQQIINDLQKSGDLKIDCN